MKSYKFIFIIVVVVLACSLIFFYFITNHSDETITYSNNELLISHEAVESETDTIIVHITGAVNSPGLVTLKVDSRISDAIEAAGGITLEADLNKVNLAYPLSDGQKIYIPNIHDIQDISYIFDSAGENVVLSSSSTSLVNINTATQTELESLSGIGPSLANTILTYRKQNGKFSCIEDLKNVPGIGESKFNTIKEFICTK